MSHGAVMDASSEPSEWTRLPACGSRTRACVYSCARSKIEAHRLPDRLSNVRRQLSPGHTSMTLTTLRGTRHIRSYSVRLAKRIRKWCFGTDGVSSSITVCSSSGYLIQDSQKVAACSKYHLEIHRRNLCIILMESLSYIVQQPDS